LEILYRLDIKLQSQILKNDTKSEQKPYLTQFAITHQHPMLAK